MALTDPPDHQQPVVRPGDGRVDTDWYRWFLLFANFTRSLPGTISTGLGTKAGLAQTWEVTFQVAKVTANPIRVIQESLKERAVTSVVTDCRSGTCTLTGSIEGVNLGGTANSVSTTKTTQTHGTANVIAVGDDLVFTPSSVSSCLDMYVTVRGTYNLSA